MVKKKIAIYGRQYIIRVDCSSSLFIEPTNM